MKHHIRRSVLVFLLLTCLGSVGTLCAHRDAAAGQILFLTFRLEKDSATATGETIRLTNRQKVAGQLKQKIKTPEPVHANDLICEFLDKQHAVLATEIMEDPLTASVEYSEEDGTLKRAQVDKKDAELFLRVQYNPLFHQLRIRKTMPGGEVPVLAEFKDFW